MRASTGLVVVGLSVLWGCLPESDDEIAQGTGTSTGTETGLSFDMPGNGCSIDVYDPNDSRVTATPVDADTSLDATLCAGGDEVD